MARSCLRREAERSELGYQDAIAAAARSYAVAYQKLPPGPGGQYLVDHAAVIYLMGPAGEPITFFSRDMDAAAMAEGIRRWVK